MDKIEISERVDKIELSEREIELLSCYNSLSEVRKLDLLGYANISLESQMRGAD